MTDSLMPIAVAVLVPLCCFLAVGWYECRHKARLDAHRLVSDVRRSLMIRWRLQAALKHYADKSNWQSEAGKHSAAYRDKGKVARDALRGES